MNNRARRRIIVSQEHYLYQSSQHLENNDYTSFDYVDHIYDANTPIATVRCFWQHIVSSTVGANLVNIQIGFKEEVNGVQRIFVRNVMDRHRDDGTPVTIGHLAGLGNNTPNFLLLLWFDYIVYNVVDEPHCICNL